MVRSWMMSRSSSAKAAIIAEKNLPSPAAGCGRIYEEQASTRKATADRPGLSAALDYLRAGDALVVWKLDRLGRSVKDVLTIADNLHERGVGVRILTGKLSGTYSPNCVSYTG